MNEAKRAQFHLPGLFEFYDFYRVFLPLYRTHREYFYDWCEIASIYGAPEGCLWGGGRVGCGNQDPHAVLALTQEYGLSARLTFSNSLLTKAHLADSVCNALCRLFSEADGPQNGVIVHSDLLLDYLRAAYPQFYFISSTTKVLTDFPQLRQELEREAFRFVVPDFRLSKSFAQLLTLPQPLKGKVEFLCNECCWFGCKDRKACYEAVSRKISESMHRTAVLRRVQRMATVFPGQWKTPAFSASAIFKQSIFPWVFPTSSWKAAVLAAP